MLKLVTAGSALAFVVALIFVTGAIGRWLSPRLTGYLAASRSATSRPAKSDRAALVRQIDPRRRLHVMEISGCEVAILTGGPNDVMVALGPQTAREIGQ